MSEDPVRGPRRVGRASDRDSLPEEMESELRFHLEQRREQLVRAGLPRERAEAEALRRYGEVERARREMERWANRRVRSMRMREQLSALEHELRFTLRQLRRAPFFTIGIIGTFMLGIGANAMMFQIVDRLLLRAPAYLREAETVGRVYFSQRSSTGDRTTTIQAGFPTYEALRDGVRGLPDVGAQFTTDLIVGSGDRADLFPVTMLSANVWSMFDAKPPIGRFFTPEEDRKPLGDAVAVLSHGFWRAHFGGTRDVVGQSLRIGSRLYTVIGVAPAGFTGFEHEPSAVFVPITAAAADVVGAQYTDPNCCTWLELVARRASDVSPEQANSALTLAYHAARRAHFGDDGSSTLAPSVELGPLLLDRGPMARPTAKVALWLSAIAAIVLVIACVNIATLLLARASRRRSEFAIRVALGVSGARLAGQVLLETMLLALAGGAAALLLAHWGTMLLSAQLLPDSNWQLSLGDGRVLMFTAAATGVAALLVGTAAALYRPGSDLATIVRTGGRDSAERTGLRTSLLVLQSALATALLIGAGLFVRSLIEVQQVPLGYDADRILFVNADFRGTGLDNAATRAVREQMLERLQAMPEVADAALTMSVPFWRNNIQQVRAPGVDSSALDRKIFALNAVSPEYFATMGTPVLRGRGILASDQSNAPHVVVVSKSMADLLWPRGDALGQCIMVARDETCRTVVGIAGDIRRSNLRDEAMLQYYLPHTQYGFSGIFARIDGDVNRAIEPIRRALQPVVPAAALVTAVPLQDRIEIQTRPWRLGASVLAGFGALAILLAAFGVFSLVAFEAARRVREMAVRLALGARPQEIVRATCMLGLRPILIGAGIGVVIALAFSAKLSPLLFEVSPRDPATFAGVIGVLMTAALAACVIPARRTTRISPATMLRND